MAIKAGKSNAAAALARIDAAKATADLAADDDYAEPAPAAGDAPAVDVPASEQRPANASSAGGASARPAPASVPEQQPADETTQSGADARDASAGRPAHQPHPAPAAVHVADLTPTSAPVSAVPEQRGDTESAEDGGDDLALDDDLPALDLAASPMADAVDPTGFEIPPQLHALVMREASRLKSKYRSPQTQILLAALEEAAPLLPRLVAEDGRQVVDSPLFGRRVVEAPVARGQTKRLQVRPKWDEHMMIKRFADRLGVPTVVVVRAALRHRYRKQLAAQDRKAASAGKSGVRERS